MGKNPFCYHAKLGGGKEFANCSHLVATRTEAERAFPFISRVIVGARWPGAVGDAPAAIHSLVALLIVANTPPNEANEGHQGSSPWRPVTGTKRYSCVLSPPHEDAGRLRPWGPQLRDEGCTSGLLTPIPTPADSGPHQGIRYSQMLGAPQSRWAFPG